MSSTSSRRSTRNQDAAVASGQGEPMSTDLFTMGTPQRDVEMSEPPSNATRSSRRSRHGIARDTEDQSDVRLFLHELVD